MRHRAAAAVFSLSTVLAFCGGAIADEVKDWNQLTLNAIKGTSTPPPRAARALAMVHTAIYDSVNAVDRQYTPFSVDLTAAPGTDKRAAAISAAYEVSSRLFSSNSTQLGLLTSAYTTQLAAIPDSPGKAAGVALGQSVGTSVWNSRLSDGSTASVSFPGSTAPGRWRPTTDNPAAAALPQWGNVTPFAIPSGSAYRQDLRPALNSAAYSDALNQVKSLGRATGSTRTPEQTDIAFAWAFNAGTVTPPGAWNLIAQSIADRENFSLTQNARLFAALNVGLADAAIAAWDCKYNLDFWRPITAIQNLDPATTLGVSADPTWTPLLTTPNHPSYVSGHSTFSRTAADILAGILGTDAIDVNFAGDFGRTRHLTSLNDAANEAGMSRIFGGIHFSFDNIGGQDIGRQVAQYVLANRFGVIPAPSAAGLIAGAAMIAARRRRR